MRPSLRVLLLPVAATILLSVGFFGLSVSGGAVFLSPDETAVAVAARSFASIGSFRLEDPLSAAYPWVHPRSFVSTGDAFVPVGFLGMPFIMAGVWRLLGDAGFVLFTPLLALSVVIPLWSAASRWGNVGRISTVVGWLTFPTVMLYANRGLFPNLPVLCLAIWAAWAVSRKRGVIALAVGGGLTGLAAFIRPTELLWVGIWVAAAYLIAHPSRKIPLRTRARDLFSFLVPFAAVAGLGAVLAWMTYGSPLAVGYQLRDPTTDTAAIQAASRVSWYETWVFGFHPRNVWYNATSYLVAYLLPWAVLAAFGAVLAWKDRIERRWTFVAVATVAILCLLYGQGIYHDHVKPDAVTLGNSFLRYGLPVAAMAALALGRVAAWMSRRMGKPGYALAAITVALTASLGIWTATVRDDEGIVQGRLELLRYAAIRDGSRFLLEPGTVVLSDRSDKIFFPAFRAAAPMPDLGR
ncbi:hypothetical protein L0Y59_05190, partial [Candidatus Uhrbacteria bacterium]|nr:hypothetical protein [Candidatus Uhrbacteria bacterium]